MDLILTLIAILGGFALMFWMMRIEKREPDLTRPQMVPTTPLMFVGALVVILGVVHLLTIGGIELPQR